MCPSSTTHFYTLLYYPHIKSHFGGSQFPNPFCDSDIFTFILSWVPQSLYLFPSITCYFYGLFFYFITMVSIVVGYYPLQVWVFEQYLCSMEKNSVDYSPLLSLGGDETNGYAGKASPLVSATKWTLKSLIWFIFLVWAAFIFLLPSEPVHDLFSKWLNFSSGSPFGVTGFLSLLLVSCFLFFSSLCGGVSEFKLQS